MICVRTLYYPNMNIKNKRFKISVTKHWRNRFHHFVYVKSYANTFVVIAIITSISNELLTFDKLHNHVSLRKLRAWCYRVVVCLT